MRVSVFLCAAVGLGLLAGEARADDNENSWDGGYKVVATRRSGFVAGLNLGLSLGNADGYPNDLAKINNVDFERNTKFGVGGTSTLWLGGALTDWFIFGLGVKGVTLQHEHAKAAGSAFIFHVQGYPLFSQGGPFRDLSLFGDFGAGSMKITGGTREDANGGLMSVIGLGAAWEPVRFWHFTFGPGVEYVQEWSQSMTLNTVLVDARLTFVGGP